MPDFDDDPVDETMIDGSLIDDSLITAAFSRYRSEVMSDTPALDLIGVKTIARRRGRTRLSAIAAVAVTALAVPAGTYALAGGWHRDPHQIGPNPSVSTSGSPSQRPSTSGGLSGVPNGRSSAPDGRIAAEELAGTAFDLPEWLPPTDQASGSYGCPVKQVRLRTSAPGDLYLPYIDEIVYGDVDGDGAQETVALLECLYGQAALQQVVAFDRYESGRLGLLGQVVRHGRGTGAIARLYSLEIDHPTGGVGVELSDRFACCGSIDALAEHQERWYSWDGQRFRQTDGPTAFTPVPKEYGKLTGTMTTLTLGAPSNGIRRGTFTVTVSNAGPGTAPGIRLGLSAFANSDGGDLIKRFTVTGSSAGCSVDPKYGFVCHYPALASGASRTYTFTVTSPTGNDTYIVPGAQLRSLLSPEQPGVRMLTNPGEPGTDPVADIKLAS